MRKKVIAVLMGAFILSGGCVLQSNYQIALVPEVGTIGIDKTIPLEVGLLISEETRGSVFTSAPYPDRRLGSSIYTLEPYQLPIGQAFEKAALQIFSRVFEKVTLLRTSEEARNYPVVFEPKLEDFYLHLDYYRYARLYPSEVVDGQCKARVTGTLINRGSPIWQKRIETPAKTERWVSDDWLGKSVGELASDTIVLALKDLAYRMVEESKPPQKSTPGWLEEIDRGKR
jgi:hypothetical protein